MLRPRLLLLDEPSLGLAPLITREVFKIAARDRREEGTTMLIVEQNANLALDFADARLRAGDRPDRARRARPTRSRADEGVRRAYLGWC